MVIIKFCVYIQIDKLKFEFFFRVLPTSCGDYNSNKLLQFL